MQLLERASQLHALDSALSEVESGEGRIALVYGEAGIGKTSLVEHFIKDKEKTWQILRGACDSLFTPRPLGPLHDVALQTQGRLLKLLESDSKRPALFSACLAELQGEPTILVIEDIHWADEATLDLLKYVGRRIRQTAALMILTYRDDELGLDHPLQLLLGDLVPSKPAYRIAISPLSRQAVRELAQARHIDAGELHRLTNGNPFFVTEVLGAESGIPATVRDAVLARAARLSPRAHRLLEAAAVIGLRAEPWLLSAVGGADGEGVNECISRGMLRDEAGDYAFRHELARQTILESIPAQRRTDLHRAALKALAASPQTSNDLTRLAHHAEGTGDASAVLEYAPAAARHASAAGSHRESVALYELALKFAGILPSLEHARLLDAYMVDLQFTDRLADEIPARQKAIELWRATGDRLRQGAGLAGLAVAYLNVGRKKESDEVMRAAVTMLEALPPSVELARAYAFACYCEMMYRDCAEALAWGEKAAATAERLEDAETLARAYNYMGCAALILDYHKGLDFLERSLAIAREADLPFAVAGTLGNLGGMLLEVRQLPSAQRYLVEGIAYSSDHDDDYHRLEMEAWQALAYMYQGHWVEAVENARQVLERPDLANVTRVGALFTLARLAIRQDDSSAASLITEVLALSIHPDSPRFDSPRLLQTEAPGLATDEKSVLEDTRPAFEAAVRNHNPWIAGELAFWRWRAGDEFTPPDWIAKPYALQIAGDWRGAAKEWEQRGCPYEQAMALMDGDEAAQLAALEIFERLGARPMTEKLKRKMRLEGIRGIPRGPRPSTRENAFGLTTRELDVLSQLVRGSSNNAIARQLSLSTRTVEHHIASILQKTGTQSRGEAVALALKESLFPAE